METILKTNELTKRYGFKAAVDRVSMTIRRGDIYGFVGLNGAGKTTLIRLLSGLSPKTSGSFELFGTPDGGDVDRARKRVSVMVESPALYLNLTGAENLRVMLAIRGRRDDPAPLLRAVGLEPNLKVKVKAYSLGMRQRLGLAMALAGDPELLLFDEPTNGLDPEGIVEVREVLLGLNAKGVTILVSSHILNELGKIATAFGFIDDGKLVKEIDADTLRAETVVTTVIEVSDPQAAANALCGRPGKGTVTLEGEIDLSETVHALDAAGVHAGRIRTERRDLESYFLSLIGGAR